MLVLLVVAVGAFTVSRLHTIFGSDKRPSYADTQSGDASTKVYNPKKLVYEVFGAPGTVADISYFDVDGTLVTTNLVHPTVFYLLNQQTPLQTMKKVARGLFSAPALAYSEMMDRRVFNERLYGLLEGPHYSRPEHWLIDGASLEVPAVLLSGHHAEIARWRRDRSLELTARRRPDLIVAARSAGRLSAQDERFLSALGI